MEFISTRRGVNETRNVVDIRRRWKYIRISESSDAYNVDTNLSVYLFVYEQGQGVLSCLYIMFCSP